MTKAQGPTPTRRRKEEEQTTMPKTTTQTADPPKHTSKPTPSKPQGIRLPIIIQIQPPKPEQAQQITKTNVQQNNKKQENNNQGTVAKTQWLQVPKRLAKKHNDNLRRKTTKTLGG